MNRREFLKLMGSGAAASALSPARMAAKAAEPQRQEQPNIVLIMSDDVSCDLYGCYGNDRVKTPNLDRMARQGVMFRTCWASALCAPTRAMIMTGRYGNRTGYYHNGLQMPQKDGSNELLKFHHSFAKLLKQAGYATAIAGKWHCSSSRPESPDGGFDEYCLWEGVKEIENLPGRPKFEGAWEDKAARTTTSRYWHPGITRNRELLRTKPNDFGPAIFTDFICDFMERKKDQPFLVYYPMVAPHGTREGHTTTPLRGRVGEMARASSEETQARFEALNEYTDVLVGRIQAKIERLGIADRTIVLYCSDNGTAVTAKSRAVERGCRVPMVISGAGIKKRGATDEIVDLSDILPTLVDFAGAKIPTGYEVDGKSLKPFLVGKADTHRTWIYSVIGTSQLVRTKRYLLEAVNPILGLPHGRLYDCRDSRDGRGYRRITDSALPGQTRRIFDEVLSKYPPLQREHPYFQTKRGKRFLDEYTQPGAAEKHLHNHRDYKFYQE
ncbi:MAG: sulfatase-like hydrolase/transferase [Phycisphaerales bacterium]|nr:MAG: sulfatase-like hydrolase/transferase [Phycisphaerales bacterium]